MPVMRQKSENPFFQSQEMAPPPPLLLLLLFVTLLFATNASFCASQQQCLNLAGAAPSRVQAGHWISSYYRNYPISHINTSLYTHLYYHSLAVDSAYFTVSLPPADEVPLFAKFSSSVKSSNPSLNTILSIAATDDHQTSSTSNTSFSFMATDASLRATFINSAVELAQANGFDGMDLAWQFPTTPRDMANLAVLLSEWRGRIDAQVTNSTQQPLLLTATVYFSNHIFDLADDNLDYPIDALSYYLDWVNALTFGFRKNSNNITTADAPLYDKASHFSASYGIISWLDAGLPPCKLVMGMPLYGRSWFLKNKTKNAPGAPVVAQGPKQKQSNRTGLIAFAEIQEMIKDPSTMLIFDNESVSSYVSSGDLWISFDTPEVMKRKIEFALEYQLLGYFLWPISFDDSNNTASKRASTTWIRYQSSVYFEVGEGVDEADNGAAAETPFYPPPKDHKLSTSAATGSATTIHTFPSWTLLILHFLCCLPTLLHISYSSE